jgi:tetratricopeptide (TPR) repeat protein
MGDVIDQVETILNRAKAARRLNLNEESVGHLEEAAGLLNRALAQIEFRPMEATRSLESDLQELSPNLLSRRNRIAEKLADVYGQQGGRYRSMGDLDKALEKYVRGREIEQDARYGIVNSYNLTNSLVVPILQDPANLAKSLESIRKAAGEVARQARGKRRDQWWSWADLGLLSLLSGDEDQALEAYRQFLRAGARDADVARTIDLLRELRDCLREAEPDIARRFGVAIEFLDGQRLR